MTFDADVRVTFRCLCGDVMVTHCSLLVLREIEQNWAEVHHGKGHGYATAKQAAAARKKQIKRQLTEPKKLFLPLQGDTEER
jgi:hypothetical protein